MDDASCQHYKGSRRGSLDGNSWLLFDPHPVALAGAAADDWGAVGTAARPGWLVSWGQERSGPVDRSERRACFEIRKDRALLSVRIWLGIRKNGQARITRIEVVDVYLLEKGVRVRVNRHCK